MGFRIGFWFGKGLGLEKKEIRFEIGKKVKDLSLDSEERERHVSVSYTHLTLPTIYSV